MSGRCRHGQPDGYCVWCDMPSAAAAQKAKRSQAHHEFQVALIEHLKLHEHLHPELKLIHAIPNGGLRDKRVAAKLKAEGAKAGIPDLFLPVVVNRIQPPAWEVPSKEEQKLPKIRPGLYIEIKANPRDKLSDAQKWWKERLEKQGYCYYVARNMQDTIEFVLSYLRGEV